MVLIQVLVAAGLLGVLSLGFASIMTEQQKSIRSMRDSLAATNLQGLMSRALSDGKVCHFVLNNPTVRTFNATAVSANTPQEIAVDKIPAADNAAAPILAKAGDLASPYSQSLLIESISLSIHSGAGTNFLANWVVKFSSPNAGVLPKPLVIPTTLTADVTAPAAAKVTGCMGFSPLAPGAEPILFGGMYAFHYTFNRCESPNPSTGDCSCPPGFNPRLLMKNGRDDGSPLDNQDLFFCFKTL